MADGHRVFGIGHGTASRNELSERLLAAGVQRLVDVRTAPGSHRHPHVARAQLEQWLPELGIEYRWDARLGGFRRPAADSPDIVWRNASFRGYAGHLRTTEARAALHVLMADAASAPTAFMCSETLWWRCHRRLISDVLLLVHGYDVEHLMPSGPTSHRPTPGARREGDVLFYDGSVTSAAQ